MNRESKRSLTILSVVAVAGAGTMTVELSAVRLLAPWFGASSGVWTNVIGVILLALALGYLIGARLACRAHPVRLLGLALLLSGAFTVWLPFFAAPVAEAFIPRGLALDEAAGLLLWGSLAASLVLFLPAALLLGCVGPLAVEAVQNLRGGHAGDAGGRVLGASTFGSIAGTFATTHVLLPRLGIEHTFLLSAAVLGLLGVFMLVLARRARAPSAAAALLLVLGLATSRYAAPLPAADLRLLAARQSPYQSIRVVERGEGAERIRFLQVNESLDSFQSVWQPEPGLLPPAYYYNLFALPPAWSRTTGNWRMLVIGLGAGTVVRVLEGALPEAVRLISLGAEIDPVVVELGRRWFELEANDTDRRVFAGLDGRAALRFAEGAFDEIVLDAYADNMEIPAHLSTVEFFREVRSQLRPGGWLAVNLSGFGFDDPVISAVAGTVAAAFERRVLALRVPFSRNCVLFARAGDEPPAPRSAAFRLEGGAVASLVPSLELDGGWRWFEPGEGRVLTDDENPIDQLQLRSITRGRARWIESL